MSKVTVREKVRDEVVRLLSEERKRSQISGNSLAAMTGLSQSLISSLEKGPWNPTLDTLLRIGDALQLDVGEIISRARKTVLSKKG